MKILYYDCFCGISGDMNLAALLDLGVSKEKILEKLDLLPVKGEYEIIVKSDKKNGISGTAVHVRLKKRLHKHRRLGNIREIYEKSGLSDKEKTLAMKIFNKIATAEASVHGKNIEQVHFHEIGAVDSIVDITAAVAALTELNVDEIWSSPVHLGSGYVKCAHGIMPVPAPATAEILKNIPINMGKTEGETTTPTGAAILTETVIRFIRDPEFNIIKTGYGIGHKDFSIPNILRVFLAETNVRSSAGLLETAESENILLEVNLDDMPPEDLGRLPDLLLKAGALDVFFTNIMMKKNRPAVKLSVLADKNSEGEMARLIFSETTTFGIRISSVRKKSLKREIASVETPYGSVRKKTGTWIYNGEEFVKTKWEFEDLNEISEKTGKTLSELRREMQAFEEGTEK